MGSSAEEVRQALEESGADVLALVDESSTTRTPYRAGGTPTTYLVDGAGVIQWSQVGYGEGTEGVFRTEVEELLEK
jgi:hypothetical protein